MEGDVGRGMSGSSVLIAQGLAVEYRRPYNHRYNSSWPIKTLLGSPRDSI